MSVFMNYLKLFPFLAFLCPGFLTMEAGAPDTSTRNAVRLIKAESSLIKAPARTQQESELFYGLAVELKEESAMAELQELGCKIPYTRGNLALCFAPYSVLDALFELPSLGEISSGATCSVTMDEARLFCGVDDIHNAQSGLSLTPFDGSGVIVGFSDIGFDPSHISFKDRVSRFSAVNDYAGEIVRMDDPALMLEFDTDNSSQTHACMVGNVLAGSRDASVYYGTAPGASLVAATSGLTSVGVLAGVEEIIDYAASVDRTAIVSISIASYTGPHDGTDLVTEYLNRCAEDATILVTAGNEGNTGGCRSFSFTDPDAYVINTISGKNSRDVRGETDFWGEISQIPEMVIQVWEYPGWTLFYNKVLEQGEDFFITPGEDPEGLGKYFKDEGGIAVSNGWNAANGKFNIDIQYQLTPLGGSKYYAINMGLRGTPGDSFWAYTDQVNSTFMEGQSERSVNNWACGKNTLCVGAHTARSTFEQPNGNSYVISYPYNQPAPFSGYATSLDDGRSLPDFVAPGVGMMTAVSRHYTGKIGFSKEDEDGKVHNFKTDDGTSFSTPYAAGVLALWQQANPYLSVEELRDIARRSATQTVASRAVDPRSGAGVINPARGLELALTATNLHDVMIDERDLLTITVDGSGKLIANSADGAEIIDLTICTPNGTVLNPASALTTGLYIVSAATKSQRKTIKISIH